MAKGFNRPKGMSTPGGQGGMMQRLQAMQAQMEAAQALLAEESVTATVGGGAVKVTMSGNQVCKAVEIDPELLKDLDAEMLQDMVTSAVNMALDLSRKLQEERMGPISSGLGGMGF
jgi:nucleoid-associated protein EbfC